jgi:hypothetical protein
MKTYSKLFFAIMMIAILILSLTMVGWTAQNVVSGQKVGVGGLTVKGGNVKIQTVTGTDKFTAEAATGNTAIAGTLVITGASTIPIVPIVAETTAARAVTSADYGKIIACSYAGATTITLPAPSSSTIGATFFVAQTVDQTLTIIGATADNNAIIADGVLTADQVAFSTASHKIGAMARVTGISATKWLITNASSCAMTVEAAD